MFSKYGQFFKNLSLVPYMKEKKYTAYKCECGAYSKSVESTIHTFKKYEKEITYQNLDR